MNRLLLVSVLVITTFFSYEQIAAAFATTPCPCDTAELPNGVTGNDIIEFICPGGMLGEESNAERKPADIILDSDIPPKPTYVVETNSDGDHSCTINEDGVFPVFLVINRAEFLSCYDRLNTACDLDTRPIPTLSEWGLIAMAGIIGIAGLIAIRKRALTS